MAQYDAHLAACPYRLSVRSSSAGLGIYAEERIPKGAYLMEYKGEIISSAEADRRGGKYLFDLSTRRTIDGSTRANVARYINHSCKPNCEAEIDGSHIYFYAKRAIRPGEELTYDYGPDYFNTFIKPAGCRCSACQKKEGQERRI